MPPKPVVNGLALYLRKYSTKEHGTPAQLMQRMKDCGASWVAIAGPWDDTEGLRFINSPDVCRRLLDAAADADLDGYIWGYPWLGREEAFADAIMRCAREKVLLDPELGANPTRAVSGPQKAVADRQAAALVNLLHARMPHGKLGLSTFGSGVRMKWFPMNAYARALAAKFPGRAFVGGQTYTNDANIDPSIADFLSVINKNGGTSVLQLVPNFGTYARVNGAVRSKTPQELDAHFMEFINENEPVEALIGWAENFMKPGLWTSFSKMADLMARGATKL